MNKCAVLLILLLCTVFSVFACRDSKSGAMITENKHDQKSDTVTLGAGCFWCVEAVYQQVKGVLEVQSGYAGGDIPNPDYRFVCTGESGYTEVCRIVYDPEVIRFEELLKVFWEIHNPTTLNRQGADVGPQYRSVIFYHNPEQQKIAQELKDRMNEQGAFPDPVVTAIEPVKNYYPAENYHQDYYNNNKNQGYCRMVIAPKLEKFEKIFGSTLSK